MEVARSFGYLNASQYIKPPKHIFMDENAKRRSEEDPKQNAIQRER